MPRKSLPAVASKNVKTQAIVRAEPSPSKPCTKNSRKHPHKTTKARGSYLPEAKVLRIQQRYIKGQNKSEIAKKEKVDRGTVARIVKFPEVRNFIAEMQQEFYGLVPDALAAIRHSLRVEKNPTIAHRILEGTGVAPHQNERLQMPETIDGYSRQALMVASVLLEGHEHFGVDLPPEIEKVLEKDRECSKAEARQPSLPKNPRH